MIQLHATLSQLYEYESLNLQQINISSIPRQSLQVTNNNTRERKLGVSQFQAHHARRVRQNVHHYTLKPVSYNKTTRSDRGTLLYILSIFFAYSEFRQTKGYVLVYFEVFFLSVYMYCQQLEKNLIKKDKCISYVNLLGLARLHIKMRRLDIRVYVCDH